MPELPDVTVYIEALDARIRGAQLLGVRLARPFALRSVEPPLPAATGRKVTALRRLGKRIVIETYCPWVGHPRFRVAWRLVEHPPVAEGRRAWWSAGRRVL